MNIQIHQLLKDLGIELSEQDSSALAEHIDSTLRQRVIDEIVDYLDESQTQELAGLNGAEETVIEQWLKNNVPELKEIIEDEVDILLGEIAQKADSL